MQFLIFFLSTLGTLEGSTAIILYNFKRSTLKNGIMLKICFRLLFSHTNDNTYDDTKDSFYGVLKAHIILFDSDMVT